MCALFLESKRKGNEPGEGEQRGQAKPLFVLARLLEVFVCADARVQAHEQATNTEELLALRLFVFAFQPDCVTH